jgi:integrase/recombinase XerD
MDQHITIREEYTALTFFSEAGEQITVSFPSAAQPDQHIVSLWLQGKAQKTQEAYAMEAARFYRIVNKSLLQVELADLYRFMQHPEIQILKESSQARALAAVKSLLTFASSTVVKFLPVNVGAAMKLPKFEDTLAERIMSEQCTDDMLMLEQNPRNHALLSLLYYGGLRVSELCNLKWKHLHERTSQGQITVYGKGKKTRHILLDAETWAEVWALRKGAPLDDYVFLSRQGKRSDPEDHRLDDSRVHQIVRTAADRAGVAIGQVSPHWLRHAHATHALENGAPITLVKETLGHKSIETTYRYLHVRPSTSSALNLRAAQKERKRER